MKRKIALGLIIAGIALLAVVGLVAYVAYPNVHEAYVRGCNIYSMIAIKDVAIALEHYRQEHGTYPAAKSIRDLQEAMVPSLANARVIDRWGEPLVVDVTATSYTLTSKGENRTAGHQFGGPVTFPGHSITLRDGKFVQYDSRVELTAHRYEQEIRNVQALARDGV